MKRRDLLKKLVTVTAGAIVGVPLASAVINEKPKINTGLSCDFGDKSGDWSNIIFTSGNQVYINGEWKRQLTEKDVSILFNNATPLTYGEYKNTRLLPDRIIKFWVKDKENFV